MTNQYFAPLQVFRVQVMVRYSVLFFCILLVGLPVGEAIAQVPVKQHVREQASGDSEGNDTRKSKKERRKEKRKRKEAEEGSDNAASRVMPKTVAGGKHKEEIYYPETKKKKRYRVDVIVPLFLDELVNGEAMTFKEKMPDKAIPGLTFYQGLKLASDSLKRAGMKMDIYIHDAGSFSTPPEELITAGKLDSTDLIIGVVEQHDIPALATYAKKKKINFVSALTNYDGGVKGNQYFTMLQPTVKSYCEFIIDDLSAKYPGQNVTLLYRTLSLADDNAALYLLNDQYSDVTFKKLLCNTLPGRRLLTEVFDTSKPNIVVVSTMDYNFADSILRALSKHFPNTHFEVYGMPTWNEMQNLRKPDKYKNLTVNVVCPFNFEKADSAMLQAIRSQYQKEFGGSVTDMVMRGYETMLWYGNLLWQYGTIFNNNYKDNSGAPFTKFKVRSRRDRNGSLLYLENKHIYMATYQGGVYETQ